MTTPAAPLPGATRREEILQAAARLFAERGYHGVGVDEIGAAVGITGPGLYRHFRGKKAMLAELLVGISEELLRTGTERIDGADGPPAALDALIRGHVGFALDSPDLITLHGRELAHLSAQDRKSVRRLQRQYVELWVDVTGKVYPEACATVGEQGVRAAVHAVFGLINSTPYSGAHDGRPAAGGLGRDAMEALLRRLAYGALTAI